MAKEVKTSSDVPVPVPGLRPLAANGVGCPAAGLSLKTGELSCHYILVAELSLYMTLDHNKPILKNT